jgi:hypothetical protein
VSDDDLLDAFAETLRAEPPPIDAKQTAALVARARPRPSPVYTVFPWAMAAVVLLAIGAGVLYWTTHEDAPVEAPIARGIEERRVGPHSIVSDDAIYELHDGPEVELTRGHALFVIAPLEGGSFVVRAGDTNVRVTGTVFGVSRDGDDVSVHVYEGSVEVTRGREVRSLGAGDSFGERALSRTLDERGRAEADARAEEPPPPAEPPPVVVQQEPPPAPRVPTDTEIRRLIAAGQHREALAASERAVGARPRSSELWMLRGDALRGLGNRADAARAYERAMTYGSSSERAIAGLSAARVTDDPTRAVAYLEDSGALEPSSPVRDAAQALRERLAR